MRNNFLTTKIKENLYCLSFSFAQPILIKFLFHNENVKIISKTVNLKKKKKLLFSYTVYNVCVMFYYEILWFYQDFNIENLWFFRYVLSSRSENTGTVT